MLNLLVSEYVVDSSFSNVLRRQENNCLEYKNLNFHQQRTNLKIFGNLLAIKATDLITGMIVPSGEPHSRDQTQHQNDQTNNNQ